jgi:hypothetical protein
MGPTELQLESAEPWIPKEYVFFPYVHDEEPHLSRISIGVNLEVHIMSNHPPFIVCVIYIE